MGATTVAGYQNTALKGEAEGHYSASAPAASLDQILLALDDGAPCDTEKMNELGVDHDGNGCLRISFVVVADELLID